MKIAAVVVTFNRKSMLLETLASLRNQSRALDHIVVIDNDSTDGTRQHLLDHGVLDWGELDYHKLDENTGGAGGFSYGMKMALEADYDWIWTMDDDVEPKADALETLLQYTDISECINSTKVFSENNETQLWEQYFDFATGRLIDLKNASFRNGKEWCPVNVACFEGMLASTKLIKKISPPDPNYFIYHDDTVFGIKASFHTNVIYVRDAIFLKKVYGYGDITPLRCYYMIRNTFRLKREVFDTGLVGSSSKLSNFLFFVNLTALTLKSIRQKRKLQVLKSLLRGWRDGFRGV